MSSDRVSEKIWRIGRGAPPRVLDLFSGCGGLSLGFQRAGFVIAAGIESDPDTAHSHGTNFHLGDPQHTIARDITATPPDKLIQELALGDPASVIDVIVGGPPCQAFARVGRPKLREVFDHPHAFTRDPRAQLYLEYLHYVDVLKPLAILMENVPDVLNHAGQNIAQEICELLEKKGFVCGYTLLNAAFYGVPQMRERMFLVAYRREVGAQVSFPKPIHWSDLPCGYGNSRAVALKYVDGLLRTASDYIEPPKATSVLPTPVTAGEAIGDLPPIYARRAAAAGTLKRGARRFDSFIPWDPATLTSKWALQMRTWPGFEANPRGLKDHVIRWLPRDYDIFARMRPGDQYPEALGIAEALFERVLARLPHDDPSQHKGRSAWRRLRSSIVPPYDANKFPNKWRKMWRDEPARTLMAHLGKDTYSHIHYDSAQARPISVREAARLQSFPDGFVFSGAMNSAFRQIGNAVPPLMAAALAQEMLAALRYGATTRTNKGAVNVSAG